MRRSLAVSLSFLLAASLLIAAITVGQGAPNPAAFINAYDRGLFSTLVSAPAAVVQALSGGAGALVQEFPSLANSKVNYALIEPNPNVPVSQSDTLQVYSDIYTFYTTIGANTAGVPTMDTSACPVSTAGTCDYQLFTKDTALFVYSAPTVASYSVVDPFYTRWNNGGGIGGVLGVATSAQTAVTSFSKTAGTEQTFFGGAIFSYPTGSTTPSVYGVVAPVAVAYNNAGGYAAMGFPTSEPFQVDSTGTHAAIVREWPYRMDGNQCAERSLSGWRSGYHLCQSGPDARARGHRNPLRHHSGTTGESWSRAGFSPGPLPTARLQRWPATGIAPSLRASERAAPIFMPRPKERRVFR